MPTLTIDDVRTVNQNGDATLFDGSTDALGLIMDITASADLMSLENPMFDAVFQIIDPVKLQVVASETWNMSSFTWSSFWISMGNFWDPSNYATPLGWGLYDGVFGFRGIIRAYSFPPNDLTELDAFDVSEFHWFRVSAPTYD
jgi:hypothetical protein